MAEPAAGVAASRPWRWWDVARFGLALVWLIAAATAWWTAPREQSYDRARADLGAGRVAAFQWGDRWESDPSPRMFGATLLSSSGTRGPLFAWRTADGRAYWTDTAKVEAGPATGTVDQQHSGTGTVDQQHSGAGAAALARDVLAAGVQAREGDISFAATFLGWLVLVLGVTSLGVVLSGPAPVLGTRWFWFWLVFTTPYWLGLLFWLTRDRPWAHRPPETPGPERRDRGWQGLVFGLLASFLVSALLLVLHAALGDRWIPSTG